jgi:hypothetical protein
MTRQPAPVARPSNHPSRIHPRAWHRGWRFAAGTVLLLAGAPLAAYGGILFVGVAGLHPVPPGSWLAVSVLLLLAFVGIGMLAAGTLLVARPAKVVLALPARSAGPRAGM